SAGFSGQLDRTSKTVCRRNRVQEISLADRSGPGSLRRSEEPDPRERGNFPPVSRVPHGRLGARERSGRNRGKGRGERRPRSRKGVTTRDRTTDRVPPDGLLSRIPPRTHFWEKEQR